MSLLTALVIGAAQVMMPSLNGGQPEVKWRNLESIPATAANGGLYVFIDQNSLDNFLRRATRGMRGAPGGIDWMREQVIAVVPTREEGDAQVTITNVDRLGLSRTMVRAQINPVGRRRDRDQGRPIGLVATERGLQGFELQFTQGPRLDGNGNVYSGPYYGPNYGYDPYGYPPGAYGGGVWVQSGGMSGGGYGTGRMSEEDGSTFPLRPLTSGSYGPRSAQAEESKVTILKSRNDLARWLGSDSSKSLPGDDQVEWGQEQIVVVSLGRRGTGGYSVVIDSVRQISSDRAVIRATERTPRPGMMTTQALTYPYAMVITPRRNLDYRLLVTKAR